MAEEEYLKNVPRNGLNGMRSCIGCGYINTTDAWESDPNCPNCDFGWDDFRQFTSASFSGCLAIFNNEKSWCAIWERHHHCRPGLYALDNQGEVTKEIIDHLRRNKKPLPEWVERKKLENEAAEQESNNFSPTD